MTDRLKRWKKTSGKNSESLLELSQKLKPIHDNNFFKGHTKNSTTVLKPPETEFHAASATVGSVTKI